MVTGNRVMGHREPLTIGQRFPVPHEFHFSGIPCNHKWYQWGSLSIGDNDRYLACWEGLEASWAGLSSSWEGLEANP